MLSAFFEVVTGRPPGMLRAYLLAVLVQMAAANALRALWHSQETPCGMGEESVYAREVWRIGRAGALDRLRRQTETLAEPGPGQARVAVRAVGLNFADLFACLGLYSATPAGPFVPGLEFAGVVEAVGPPNAGGMPHYGLRPGDRVIGLTRYGGPR